MIKDGLRRRLGKQLTPHVSSLGTCCLVWGWNKIEEDSEMFIHDYILGGVGHGPVANAMSNDGRGVYWNKDLRRPYFDKYDRRSVTINLGRTTLVKGVQTPIREHITCNELYRRTGHHHPVWNATTLRKEEWIMLDQVVLRPSRYRIRAWPDLAAMNSYGGFNAMGKMVLEYEAMSDAGSAQVDMYGDTQGRNDMPTYQLRGLPLPITHSDFTIPGRLMGISRNTGTPLDVNMGEMAGRRVAEAVEGTLIGTRTGILYGGNSTQVGGYDMNSQVYGYLNFPSRLTKTNLTIPTGSNPEATLADVLAMRQSLKNGKFFGPYMLYHSNDWDNFLDNDYARAVVGGTSMATSKTLRNRLRDCDDLIDVRRLDFLFASAPITDQTSGSYKGPGGETDAVLKPYTMLMVQMTPDVCRAVVGLDVTVVQWEEVGGMRLSFKCLCILVPQLRSDKYSNCGILEGSTT